MNYGVLGEEEEYELVKMIYDTDVELQSFFAERLLSDSDWIKNLEKTNIESHWKPKQPTNQQTNPTNQTPCRWFCKKIDLKMIYSIYISNDTYNFLTLKLSLGQWIHKHHI